MTQDEARSYRSSLTQVRELLERCGGAHGVTPQDLSACEADILVIKRTADHHGRPGSPIAQFFSLSDDMSELCQRLRTHGPKHHLASDPQGSVVHVHQGLPRVAG